MRVFALGITLLWGCAASTPGADLNSAGSTRSSTASMSTQVDPTTRTIEVQAGSIQLRHSIPSGARLRATTLEGLDDANRHLQYEWTADGLYSVAVSGRYRHSVSGSIAGRGRLTSTVVYTPVADTTQSSMTEISPGLATAGLSPSCRTVERCGGVIRN
jgi:hypothetical protein